MFSFFTGSSQHEVQNKVVEPVWSPETREEKVKVNLILVQKQSNKIAPINFATNISRILL